MVMHVPSNANFEHNLLALPETPRMPSAEGFAECTISSTRQNYYLTSAYQKALGKQTTLVRRKLCYKESFEYFWGRSDDRICIFCNIRIL